jgi:hypothetical protein
MPRTRRRRGGTNGIKAFLSGLNPFGTSTTESNPNEVTPRLSSKMNTFSQPAVAKNGNSVVVMGKKVSNLETQEESIRNNTRAAQTTLGLKSTNSNVNGGSRRRKRRKSIRRKKRFV